MVAKALDDVRCRRMGLPSRWHEPWPVEWRAGVLEEAAAVVEAIYGPLEVRVRAESMMNANSQANAYPDMIPSKPFWAGVFGSWL